MTNNSANEYSNFYIRETELKVNNSDFYNNSGIRGGSMYCYKVNLILENSKFNLNNDTNILYGGQFYLS